MMGLLSAQTEIVTPSMTPNETLSTTVNKKRNLKDGAINKMVQKIICLALYITWF